MASKEQARRPGPFRLLDRHIIDLREDAHQVPGGEPHPRDEETGAARDPCMQFVHADVTPCMAGVAAFP